MAGLRRNRFVDVATESFSRQGFHAVRIDDLGAAGVAWGWWSPAMY